MKEQPASDSTRNAVIPLPTVHRKDLLPKKERSRLLVAITFSKHSLFVSTTTTPAATADTIIDSTNDFTTFMRMDSCLSQIPYLSLSLSI